MSGGRFSVSSKEVVYSVSMTQKLEKNLIWQSLASIKYYINFMIFENLTLNDQGEEVAVLTAGYITTKVLSSIEKCCPRLLFGECKNS